MDLYFKDHSFVVVIVVLDFFLRVILDFVKNLEPLSVQLYEVKKSDWLQLLICGFSLINNNNQKDVVGKTTKALGIGFYFGPRIWEIYLKLNLQYPLFY